MRKILLLIFVGFSVFKVESQTYNRPVPPGFFKYEFVQNSADDNGYYFLTPVKNGLQIGLPGYRAPKMYLFDRNGYLTWYSSQSYIGVENFQYNPAHGFFTFIGTYAPDTVWFSVMDQNFMVTDSFKTVNNVRPNGHDFQVLSNGNYMLTGRKDSIMDLSAYTFDSIQGSVNNGVIGFVLQEFDQSHNLVFQWNSNEHISPTECIDQYGYSSTLFDYCHGNSVDEDLDGNFLVSFRHLNSVYKIDRVTGNTIWRLGGKSNSFTFTNDNGFSGQHDVRRLQGQVISLFDNSNCSINHQSRAVTFLADTSAMTATRVWGYKPVPAFFAFARGSHQVAPGKIHVVNYGTSFRPNPNVDVVDSAKNLLVRIVFEDSIILYKVLISPLPFSLPRPEISCDHIGDSVVLSAPGGYDSYMWSTGETSDHITVGSIGTFQVWVNYGIGMLGSFPYIITDIENACGSSGINENTFTENKIIYKIYDLTGREVKFPFRKQVCIIKYIDGTSELKYFSD